MDKFVETILSKITKEGYALSIVQNTDGFLSRVDTQQVFQLEANVTLLPGSGLDLRVHYERWFKGSGERFCYIVTDINEILPDIKNNAFICEFEVADVLWGYNKAEINKWNAPYSVLKSLFDNKQERYLTAEQTRAIMGYVAEEHAVYNLEGICDKFRSIDLNWLESSTMERISSELLYCIKNRIYPDIEFLLDEINCNFQDFMSNSYRSLLTKSHLNRPYSLNKVLPHINYNNKESQEKVALVVIDGMSYWQYIMLREELKKLGIKTADNVSFAWLPSITKLSRQAIFRGDMPKDSYLQNPSNEDKLWRQFWQKAKVPDYHVWYEYNGTVLNPQNFTRFAYVNTSLDHHMHGCRDVKDLYDLTANRVTEIAPNIKALHDAGFNIYITSDHGNVYSHSWRALTPQEKTMLFTNESRGGRHLIFTKQEYKDYFFQQNPGLKEEMLVMDNSAVWRGPKCFKGADEVTHGGSHFLEMIVPFAKIENKK